MDNLIQGSDFIKQVCDVLDIPVDHVNSVSIESFHHDPVMIVVRFVARPEHLEVITNIKADDDVGAK